MSRGKIKHVLQRDKDAETRDVLCQDQLEMSHRECFSFHQAYLHFILVIKYFNVINRR